MREHVQFKFSKARYTILEEDHLQRDRQGLRLSIETSIHFDVQGGKRRPFKATPHELRHLSIKCTARSGQSDLTDWLDGNAGNCDDLLRKNSMAKRLVEDSHGRRNVGVEDLGQSVVGDAKRSPENLGETNLQKNGAEVHDSQTFDVSSKGTI